MRRPRPSTRREASSRPQALSRLPGPGRIPAAWRRRAVALAALALVAVLAYMLWLRDSSLVAVDEVKVEGVTANREEVTAALDAAGREMTTLHVDESALRDAVSGFPTVAAISADAGFPSTLTVKVTERLPVGVVREGGEEVAVSSDGLLLTGLDVSELELPQLDARVDDGRLDSDGLQQAEVLGAAPAELRERIEASAYDLERGGVVLELDGAPELWFGDGGDAEDKWKAAVTVLADSELGSPAYVDVSVPSRVVTGG
ncbi:MAG: cell division protein FtsQ/DivIB [Solirubrobacterales bacterium]